jgi:solute carrier family 35 (UDP-xylose/UDP-N-acetylglucosamine transporter), member B4
MAMADEKGPEAISAFLDDDDDDDESLLSDDSPSDWKSVAAGVFVSALPRWLDAGVVGLLIFGGCCGNVRLSLTLSYIYAYIC